MSTATAGLLFAGSLVVALGLAYRPAGDYMYRVLTSARHWRAERLVYRAVGVNPDGEQSWGVYARSVLAFSGVSVLFLYLFQRIQHHLWLSLGFPGVKPDQAWNTAISFVTNTNWQSYSGESTMGHLVQMAGLAVQNFASAAVGIAVAVALVRGFARKRTDQLGNFWVDLVRICVRILLPVAVVGAVVFIAAGMAQNLSAGTDVHTLAGAAQHITGGPVASQEIIKEFGTNGGGFYNANSAHPFENPTAWTNWLEIFLLLLISVSLPRTFGRIVGDNRQGYAILAVMAILAIGSIAAVNGLQLAHGGTVPQAVGSATEGTETRFGVPQSATFAAATTLTSTGAVDSFHDSYSPLSGAVLLGNMMLGEVAPGGTGSGLYGMLILAVVTVFVAGLMVGRTPEYLGKKIGAREMKFAALYFLTTPTVALVGTAAAFATGNNSTALNTGPHGLAEVLYAFTSAANNNGSAFAGITVNTVWWDTALGIAMGLGRLLPIIFVLGLAGSLARQKPVPASAGTLKTYQPLFVGMVVGVTVILVALTFLPALALGPLAEGLS
ncbi:MAG: potassium-transporting ATPase potassium-binding subunit [Cryptosporangiaceae bacterium]|jgi:K+-transporting ATPase ATPase A chain|nr:potassium-transporting ATPase potassium-binding subunit [Cryptosporangiaceae bacterium]